MPLKPIVSKTLEELAAALGLSTVQAKEWQLQHALLKRLKEIVRGQKITHAEVAKRAGTSRTRVIAILNDDLEHVSSDLLVRILGSLGYRVRVSVVKSDTAAWPPARSPGDFAEAPAARSAHLLVRMTPRVLAADEIGS